MRASGLRLPILALLTLALGTAPGRADELVFLETANWIPTASVLTVPTSSLLATTTIVPTSYAIPTTYSTAYVLESAYLAPAVTLGPTYYETTFRRRGLFGRRLVETTRAYYVPTAAYLPTTYVVPSAYVLPTLFSAPAVVDRGVLPTAYFATTSTSCCGTVIAGSVPVVAAAPVDRPTPAVTNPVPGSSGRSSRAPVESEADDESISSAVEPPPAAEPPPPAKPAPARPAETRGGGEVTPPPPQPADRQQSTAPRPGPATPKSATGASGTNASGATAQPKAKTSSPPTAPAGNLPDVTPAEDDQLFPAPGDKDAASKAPGTVRRDNLRPVLPTRTIRSEYRNVLVGIVRSRGTDEPEDSVRISVASRSSPDVEKVALTNAFGKFAVRVPDGDWTVKVTMPSGRVYPVREIRVSNGVIFDDAGRDVPSLVITR
jgi:hypothetical protein